MKQEAFEKAVSLKAELNRLQEQLTLLSYYDSEVDQESLEIKIDSNMSVKVPAPLSDKIMEMLHDELELQYNAVLEEFNNL